MNMNNLNLLSFFLGQMEKPTKKQGSATAQGQEKDTAKLLVVRHQSKKLLWYFSKPTNLINNNFNTHGFPKKSSIFFNYYIFPEPFKIAHA